MADELLAQTLLETEDAPEAEAEESRTEELLRRLLDDNREANEALIRRVTATPPRGEPLQKDDLNPELNFTLEGLPDPAMDPAGFHKGYAARAQAAVTKAMQATRTAAAQDARQVVSDREVLTRAETMIKAVHPDADQDLLGYAGGVVANRLKAQGKDPMVELRTNTEAVAQDIADYIDDMAQKLGGKRQGRSDQATEGRTRGMLQPRSRTPAPRQTRDQPEDPKAFYKELTALQQKARIY